MPSHCVSARYAVGISFEPASNQDQDTQYIPRHLRRNIGSKSTIYEFTFDYDWTRAQKRQDAGSTLLRIDYSDDQGYWDEILGISTTSLISNNC